MLFLVWLIPIVGGPIIQTLLTQVAGVKLGFLGIILIYAPLFAIAGGLTARIVRKRRSKAEADLKAHEKEHGELRSSVTAGKNSGVLECTEESFIFTNADGQKEEYRFMDIPNIWVQGHSVYIVDRNYGEHKFKVDRPDYWATKIEEIRQKPFKWDGKFKVIQFLRSFEGTEEELKAELLLMRRKNQITKAYADLVLYEYKDAKKENRKINEEALEKEETLSQYWYHQGKCMKCGGEMKKTVFNKKCLSCGYIDTNG